ncbi:MAG: alpha-galactosidase [Ginsengibacter sp.]
MMKELVKRYRILAKCAKRLAFTFMMSFPFISYSQNPTWELQTSDTKIVIGVNDSKRLQLSNLSNRNEDFNWVKNGEELPFIQKVSTGKKIIQTNWKYSKAETNHKNGFKLTLFFINENPSMELISEWHAVPGRGPIRNRQFIKNLSTKTITIYKPESIDFKVLLPNKDTRLVYINDDASIPDSIGVYQQPLNDSFSKTLRISEVQDWIPFMALNSEDSHGMYFGWEWSIGRLSMVKGKSLAAQFNAGISDDFKTDIDANETWEMPPAFIGCYKGDIDDCGNSLRKYLFQNSMPLQIRDDPSFPKTEWNAFAALGKEQGSWDPVESKYYPFIDDIAPLGFEEVVIDVGWWSSYGDPGHIITDSVDWPNGMSAAAKYAKSRGLRFGLYDNESENLTSDSGKAERIRDISYLIEDLHADFYRSDATAGPVIAGTYGKNLRARYKEDVSYWSIKGFYEIIDSVHRRIPKFLWENCSSGGGLKDFGAVSRASKVQNQDIYWPVQARRSFYDASHVFPPMQLASVVGSWKGWQAEGSVYEFRSASMGAAYWHPDAPNGGNGGPVWTAQHKSDIKRAVTTYKEKLRPLIRTADLYHIFARPDSISWDGVEYFDPISQKGVVYIFKPSVSTPQHVIKLRGLSAHENYRITFEDGSNETRVVKGQELLTNGILVTLKGALISELMFIQKE